MKTSTVAIIACLASLNTPTEALFGSKLSALTKKIKIPKEAIKAATIASDVASSLTQLQEGPTSTLSDIENKITGWLQKDVLDSIPNIDGIISTTAVPVLPCTTTFTSGRTLRTATCGGETETQICCTMDEYTNDLAGCVAHCECSYEEERTGTRVTAVEENPTLLRGVPIFTQYDAKDHKGNQPVGCGGVAVSMLASWFSARGYTRLTDAYESGGEINWKGLTSKLAKEYLGTWIRNNASPTFVHKMKTGIEKYWQKKGYTVSVRQHAVKSGQEGSEFARIKASIDGGRPIVIGFDVDINKGGGIGGGGDDFGFIDHYGLVVGYDDTGAKNKLYINMGWADVSGRRCSDGSCYDIDNGIAKVDFVIGKGKIHTWHVSMKASEKTKVDGVVDTFCPLPAPKTAFKPNSIDGDSIGATFAESEWDLPIQTEIITGTDCSVVGGTVKSYERYTYTAEWTDHTDCNDRYSVYQQVLDGEWEPDTPSVGDGEPLDQLQSHP